jgi:hypothetical protein
MRKLLLGSTALAVALAGPVLAQSPCAPGTAIPNQPAAAALAGYNTLTFGPNVTIQRNGQSGNWLPYAFFGMNPATLNASQNGDGSVTIAGGIDTFNGQLATAAPGGNGYVGEVFGGGFYAEATISVAGQTEGLCCATTAFPAFWGNTIKGYLGTGSSVETDFMEMDAQQSGQYGYDIINWNMNPSQSIGSTEPDVNTGADFSQPNRFGFLWIPATSSSQGQAAFFFNGNQVGSQSWSQGQGIFSALDGQQLTLILGAGANSPMKVWSVQVWQASTAGDSINGSPAPAISPGSSVAVSNPTAQAACEAALSGSAGESAAAVPATITAPATTIPTATIATITPGQTLTDSAGNAWAITAAGTVTVNGKPAAYTADVSQIVNANGVVYQQAFGHWWGWDGSGWFGVSGDPRQGSVAVITVADATGQNYSTAPSGAVTVDGALAPAQQTAAETAAEADFQANAAAVQAQINNVMTAAGAPQDAQAEATLAQANALLQQVQATLAKGRPAQ